MLCPLINGICAKVKCEWWSDSIEGGACVVHHIALMARSICEVNNEDECDKCDNNDFPINEN